MFDILRKSIKTGVVTTRFPNTLPEISSAARGRPEIDFAKWKDCRVAGAACPTGALGHVDKAGERTATLDLGRCTFCGLCAEADPAIRMTSNCTMVARTRSELKLSARYHLNQDGTHRSLISPPVAEKIAAAANLKSQAPGQQGSLEQLGGELKSRIDKIFSRSLHIREVDAGSCNGCEIEIVGLNSPIYDLERFGIHFVASPRHADMLLVTGPVSRNMELALKKTYDATPPPRLVVAVGTCGCSGGIFGENYACVGAVDRVIPVDVYVPGCPPNPFALLQGILTAVGRAK